MADAPEVATSHTAFWDADTRTLSCSCGDTSEYLAHIAALLSTNEGDARKVLLDFHENFEVNTGMCGGCETCGDSSAAVRCLICGHADDPCLTYYVAAGHGPADEEDI